MNALRRVRLTVAYDGSGFHGFAKNPGVLTVAGLLEETLSLVTRSQIEVTGAGRTDAGVHAWGQVVSTDLPFDTDLETVVRSVNKRCAPGLAIRSVEWAPTSDFDARFDALWRHYRYTVLNAATPNPFLARTAWHITQPLEVHLMQLACDPFIGEHDFSSFCRRPKVNEELSAGQHPPTMVRRVLLAEWTDLGEGLLRFDVRATAFCHQQVRSMVGTLVEVGLGRRTAGEMLSILRARDRNRAGQVAPPDGLCLWEVGYPF